MEELVIIGSGPAGLTAAIYAARAMLSPLVITGNALGGQAATTSEVENYPGFPEGLGGLELMQRMQEQAERFGARVEIDEVLEASLSSHPFHLGTVGGRFEARSLIVATGVSPRLLGVPGEAEFKGRGVSYCATCDGFFYQGKMVAVVGGGDAAVEEAIFLTKFAQKVYIVHRRNRLRAQRIVQQRALENPRVEVIWNNVVTEVLGTRTVSGIRVRDVLTNQERVIDVDGMFSYIGNVPNTQLFQGQLDLDERGYVVTDRRMHTSVPGVFAAGDVQEKVLWQVSTAVGSGAVAAVEAERFLAELEGKAYPERQ
jgi:thioredoxin reductase (NADPH)